jgi:beta-mannosidase
VVDGDGRLKPAWYAVRRAFRDRLAVVRPAGDGLELALLNDSAEPWRGTARVERLAVDGTVLATAEFPFAMAPREGTTVPLPQHVAEPGDPRRELLVARPEGAAPSWFWFAEDVDSALPAPSYDVTAVRAGDGYDVTVTAHTLLKDLALLADRLDPDAVVDDMLLTLLPGESATLHVRTAHDLPMDALTRPVLRCANGLVTG